MPSLLRAQRERFGDRDAVATPDDRLTYRELDERSARLAGALVRLGVVKGTRVGILFPNGIDWIVTWAAAARLGAVTVPVNTFSTPAELGRFLRHADVQVLIGVTTFLRHDYVVALEQVAPEIRDAAPSLLLPSLPQLRRVLLTGGALPAWAEPVPEGDDDPAVLAVVEAMGDDVAPADVLVVSYTSGSTGDPKGVVHSHASVIRHARNVGAVSGIDETSRIWTPMPLCWVGGFVFGMLRALTAGGCFVTQDTFDAGTALELAERERVTDMAAWPGVMAAIAAHPDFPTADLSALRTGPYEALAPDRRPPDPGLAIGSLGMSETGGPHTYRRPDELAAPPEHRGTFGHPVPGVEHRIVDPETGLDVPEGTEGTVLVRGYSLMLGFHRRERADVFDADGWYHTGDRGLFRGDWFFFTGRQSDLIKTGGSNVAPPEVERCLLAMPEVAQAFVVGMPDDVRGQRVVALVVPAGDASDGFEDAVRAKAKAELSSYKVPERVLPIAAADVPWMTSQKVDRRALVALAGRLLTA